MISIVYLHGFGSGPETTSKGLYLRQRMRGKYRQFILPDLQGASFRSMTIAEMLDIAEDAVAEAAQHGPVVLCGSSLGGWLAATIAERARVPLAGLFLIAPAFSFFDRWAQLLGDEAIAEWKASGSRLFYNYRYQEERELGSDFLASCEGIQNPIATRLPAVVVHGRNDETVPLDAVWPWVQASTQAEFHVLNGDHALDAPGSLEFIGERCSAFCAAVQRVEGAV